MIAMLALVMSASSAVAADLAKLLQERIALQRGQSAFFCQEERICGLQVIPMFYARRQFQPAWVEAEDAARLLRSLTETIRGAHHDGLRVEDYHLQLLEKLLHQFEDARSYGINLDPQALVDFELLATDAFLLLGSHFLAGRVDPETIHSDWSAYNPKVDMAALLNTAIERGAVASVLESLKPPHEGYRSLKKALQQYRRIETAGGWPVLPEKVEWQPGSHDARIALLRRRLQLSADLAEDASGNFPHLFDPPLQQALVRFQARHGLPPSGRLDERTRTALMVPAGQRARQIEANLERWRWLPHDLGWRHIRVNVADFRLQVFEENAPVLSMRVVVGRDYRRTPVFSGMMRFLVINPYWNIPTRIAVKDILPKVRQDPHYLAQKKIRVFEDWSSQAREIDPGGIDWNRVDADHFRYRLRKDPGPQNDLGRIKFMFPNRFAVYLHDTPSRHLFRRDVRSFSSGCVRLEKPVDLAEYVLREDSHWNRESIENAIRSGERRIVSLPSRIPVHLLYWTVWADENQGIQFRPDVYGRDELLEAALQERPPRRNAPSANSLLEVGQPL